MDSYEVLVKPFLESITLWREQGASVVTVSRKLGISPAMFGTFMRKNQELYNAWYDGSVGLVLELEETLFKEAKGYYYNEVCTKILEDKDGNLYGKSTMTTKKFRPPQAGALLKALESMHSQRWMTKQADEKEIKILLEGDLAEYAK
jgi:hypothetical protein